MRPLPAALSVLIASFLLAAIPVEKVEAVLVRTKQ